MTDYRNRSQPMDELPDIVVTKINVLKVEEEGLDLEKLQDLFRSDPKQFRDKYGMYLVEIPV